MRHLLLLTAWVLTLAADAQTGKPVMDPAVPQEYEIGGITVSGTKTTDPNAVKLFTGLVVGEKITVPGERITKAIENLWDQKLFSDIAIKPPKSAGVPSSCISSSRKSRAFRGSSSKESAKVKAISCATRSPSYADSK